MNLVGKIFVVLIFVMSLVFMSLAVAVYATHKNWMLEVTRRPEQVTGSEQVGLKYQLEQKDAELAELTELRRQLEQQLINEKRSREQALSALTSQLAEVTKERDDLQAQHAQLVNDQANATAAMAASQATLATLQTEVETLRQEIKVAQDDLQQSLNSVVKLDDQLAQAKGEWDRLKVRNTQLLEQVSGLQLAVQDAGIQLDRTGPPRIQGYVMATLNDNVEISIGSDDGLERGHKLDVFRMGATPATTRYLGKIEIVDARPDKSIARIIPEFKQGIIQRSDRVASKLQ